MAYAVAVCLGRTAVLSITFPLALIATTPMGAFGLCAGLNLIAFVMISLEYPR